MSYHNHPAHTAEECPYPEIESLKLRLKEKEDELADLETTFDLQWKADMRAVVMWREGHPERELTLPDRTDHVLWLLEQLQERDAQLKVARERIHDLETALRSHGVVVIDQTEWCTFCQRRAPILFQRIEHADDCELQQLLHPAKQKESGGTGPASQNG